MLWGSAWGRGGQEGRDTGQEKEMSCNTVPRKALDKPTASSEDGMTPLSQPTLDREGWALAPLSFSRGCHGDCWGCWGSSS